MIHFFIACIVYHFSACAYSMNQTPAIQIDRESTTYTTIFPDHLDPDIASYLQKESALKRLEKTPPLTFLALQTRVHKDEVDLTKALHARGYFDAKVTAQIKPNTSQPQKLPEDRCDDDSIINEAEENNNIDDARYRVTLHIEPGVCYTLSEIDILYPKESVTPHMGETDSPLPLQPGDPAHLEKAEDLGKHIAKYWRYHGYPFAKACSLKGHINHEQKSLALRITIKRGPKCRFGSTDIQGLKHLSPTFVHNRLMYEHSTLYNEKQVDQTRKALIETGLFNDVHLAPKDDGSLSKSCDRDKDVDCIAPMELILKEGPPRSIGGGVHYSSSYGVSGHASWRHDNIFGGGQSFEAKVLAGARKNEARLALSLPDCAWKQQTLYTSLSLGEDITRAFRATTQAAVFQLLYDITPKIQVNYGVEGESSRIKRVKVLSHAKLMSFPVGLRYDGSDSFLNPTHGAKITCQTTPVTGSYLGTSHFWIHNVGGSLYLRPPQKLFEESDNIPVLAMWGKLAQITANNHALIPPTKRLYSGGGHSIRGYGFQLLGPLDNTATPLGGRSLMEFGTEARFALTEKFGAAAFIEGGTVCLDSRFKNRDILWGAGIGARYYTHIGPLRIDIAIPLKRRVDESIPKPSRKKIDAPFQLYITLGQAF